MHLLSNIGGGFGAAFTPMNLLYCFVGVALGTVLGMLPGLGAATGISLLLPITLGLQPLPALILLAGIYYGCMHGGIISAVLIATPGDAAAVVTVRDGHELARQGRAGPVLAMSALASFLAGTLTIPFIMTLTPLLANWSLRFGPPEISAVMLIGLVGVVGFVGPNRLKGFAMAALGLTISCVGLDQGTGIPRFTLGINSLFGGIDFLYVVIGVFAVAEVLHSIGVGQPRPIRTRFKDMMLTRDDWKHARMPILRGGVMGMFVGMIPGAGATIASFLSYDVERRAARRHGRVLGTGVIEGVAGPQAADNAAVNGAFVPTLALGVPGSAATAVLLGAFLLHGVQPGPLLTKDQPHLVWGLLASFYIGNLMLVIVNIPLAPIFASILRFQYAFLYPAIVTACFIGAFSVNNEMTGVWLVFAFGVIGWVLKRYEYPLSPLILAVILGNQFEQAVVQSQEIGRGSFTVYLHRPIALTLLAIVVLMAFGPAIVKWLRRRRRTDVAPVDQTPRPLVPQNRVAVSPPVSDPSAADAPWEPLGGELEDRKKVEAAAAAKHVNVPPDK